MLKIVNLKKGENNEITKEIKDITGLLIPFDKNLISISKISDNIISLNLSESFDFSSLLRETRNEVTISDVPTKNEVIISGVPTRNEVTSISESSKRKNNQLKRSLALNISKMDYIDENAEKSNEIVKYSKVLYIDRSNNNNDDANQENKDDKKIYIQKIKKEFLFNKNYSLLGCISNEENLLLLNYYEEKNNSQNELLIFDFNICQFIYSFKFHDKWATPKICTISNYENSIEFTVCDDDLNLIQYFYDKNYENKIYYINISKAEAKTNQKADKLIYLYKRILLICQNNDYYLLYK